MGLMVVVVGSGWGMSRASKQAKEHEKRTWEVEIMAKMVLVVG